MLKREVKSNDSRDMKRILTTLLQKWPEYLLEMIVITAGILGAFALNNWNEGRNNTKQELYFLNRLEKEFASDSSELAGIVRILDRKVETAREIKIHLENPESNGIENLVRKAILSGRVLVFRSFTPSYDEALASGQLSLIKNDSIRDKINEYKNNLEGLSTFMTEEGQRRKYAYNDHVFKYFDAEIATDIWEKRMLDTLELSGYNLNISGYTNDPQSLYYIKSVLGVDREAKLLYERVLENKLSPVLESIRSEIAQRK